MPRIRQEETHLHMANEIKAAARQEMIDHGFAPDFPPEAERQLEAIRLQPDPSLRDLTSLLWSSIDNDDSRDLDQIEWAERVPGGIRVLVGVADVDSAVARATPIARATRSHLVRCILIVLLL